MGTTPKQLLYRQLLVNLEQSLACLPDKVVMAWDNARFIGCPEVNFLACNLTAPFYQAEFLGRIDFKIRWL